MDGAKGSLHFSEGVHYCCQPFDLKSEILTRNLFKKSLFKRKLITRIIFERNLFKSHRTRFDLNAPQWREECLHCAQFPLLDILQWSTFFSPEGKICPLPYFLKLTKASQENKFSNITNYLLCIRYVKYGSQRSRQKG